MANITLVKFENASFTLEEFDQEDILNLTGIRHTYILNSKYLQNVCHFKKIRLYYSY